MEIVSTAVYVGPNVYAKQPLIRLTVDLHRRAEKPVSDYADALGPLYDELPGLATATSELGIPLPERLDEPDCRLGELMAQVAIALQNRAGAPAEVAMTRPSAHADEVEVLYGYESEEIGLEAGEVARGDHPRADRPARRRGRRHRRGDRRLRAFRRPPLARPLGAWRWCARRRRATSPGCASTTPA